MENSSGAAVATASSFVRDAMVWGSSKNNAPSAFQGINGSATVP
jgi:hypothetical protein